MTIVLDHYYILCNFTNKKDNVFLTCFISNLSLDSMNDITSDCDRNYDFKFFAVVITITQYSKTGL